MCVCVCLCMYLCVYECMYVCKTRLTSLLIRRRFAILSLRALLFADAFQNHNGSSCVGSKNKALHANPNSTHTKQIRTHTHTKLHAHTHTHTTKLHAHTHTHKNKLHTQNKHTHKTKLHTRTHTKQITHIKQIAHTHQTHLHARMHTHTKQINAHKFGSETTLSVRVVKCVYRSKVCCVEIICFPILRTREWSFWFELLSPFLGAIRLRDPVSQFLYPMMISSLSNISSSTTGACSSWMSKAS